MCVILCYNWANHITFDLVNFMLGDLDCLSHDIVVIGVRSPAPEGRSKKVCPSRQLSEEIS